MAGAGRRSGRDGHRGAAAVGEGERGEREREMRERERERAGLARVKGKGGFAECQIGGTRQSQFSSLSVVIWHSAKF